jgi:hypothetical protein
MDAGDSVVAGVVVGLLPPETRTRRKSCPLDQSDESCPARYRDAAAPHGQRDALHRQQPPPRLRAPTFLLRWEFRSAASQFQTKGAPPISLKGIARDRERSLLKPFQTPAVASLCRETRTLSASAQPAPDRRLERHVLAGARRLALQLSFCVKVRALSDRLVSSTPE